jgi:hypothetical protein
VFLEVYARMCKSDSPQNFLEAVRSPSSASVQDEITALLNFPEDINVALRLAADPELHRGTECVFPR